MTSEPSTPEYEYRVWFKGDGIAVLTQRDPTDSSAEVMESVARVERRKVGPWEDFDGV